MTDRLEIEDDQPVEGKPVASVAAGLPAPVTITDMYLAALIADVRKQTLELYLSRSATERLIDLLEQALRRPGK